MLPEPIPRLTVEQYQQMTAAGVLTAEDRIELIEGWLVEKPPQSPRYCSTIDRCCERLRRAIPQGWYVRTHGSLVTPDSLPEPAVAVVPGSPDTYMRRHPSGKDAALIVEVADTRLAFDHQKAFIYARGGVENFWIVNLIDRQLEVYREPRPDKGDYREHRILMTGDEAEFSLPTGQLLKLDVAYLLPKKAPN